MQCKFLILGLVFLIFIQISSAQVCNCLNCADCMQKLNAANCSTVRLIANISDYNETCINNPENFSNKIFDCQSNIIGGNNSFGIYGIYLSNKANNTIKNCKITNFYFGIYLISALNNTIFNNSILGHNIGLKVESSENNSFVGNNISHNNNVALELNKSSSGNFILRNTISFNAYNGIVIYTGKNNHLISNVLYGNDNQTGNNPAISINDNYTLLQDNIISDNGGTGLQILSANNYVFNTTVLSNNENGIYLGTNSFNNTLIANILDLNKNGIFLYNSANNTIRGNSINKSLWNGIALSNSQKNVIINNSVKYNNYHGLYIMDASSTENNITLNIFCYNNRSSGNYYDIYDSDANNGSDNTCNTAYNYNDSGKEKCTYTCAILPEYCNSCISCTDKLNGNYPLINLNSSITTSGSGTCININANNITFNCSNYLITGSGSGIAIQVNNNFTKVMNCNISSFERGIYLYYSYNSEISSNVLHNNSKGIWLFNSNSTKISNNFAYNNSNGIYLDRSYFNEIYSNRIQNNSRGLHIENSKNNTIISNTITDNYVEGLYFTSTAENNSVLKNTICYNKGYDIQNNAGLGKNFGSENFCNITLSWKDSNATLTNCTYYCGQILSQTFSIFLNYGWNLISIPLNLVGI
ncbi:MAG: right-handed parallel beta-helix repeat-containing protein [Candidatus Altiarchaeota archaeon]